MIIELPCVVVIADVADPVLSYPLYVVMGPVRRQPRIPGAFVRDPAEVPEPLRVTVRSRLQPWSIKTKLDQGKDYRWQDQLNEAGAASVVLANDDPDLATIEPGDRILYEVQGYAAFTLLPREISTVTLAAGEEASHLTTVSGPGTLALLEEGLVYPSTGPGVWPIQEDRLFSWPSTDYNDAWWGPSDGIAKQSEPNTYWSEANLKPGWPDGDAMWMWGPGYGRGYWAPPGPCYFRTTVEVPEGAIELWCHAAFDDIGEVFVDGESVLQGEFGPNPMMTGNPNDEMNRYEGRVSITPGTHTIAIKCDNGIDPEGDTTYNPGGVLFTCYAVGAGGETSAALRRSDSGWKCLAYPTTPPGMTPGEVLGHCIREAKNRGVLLDVETAFNDVFDSAGVEWPVVGDIATKVGTDCLTFFREISQTYIDFAMSPAGAVLYAWVSGTRGELRDVELHQPIDPADPNTGNLAGLTHKRLFTETERGLVRWSGGWSEVQIPKIGGREVLLGLGAVQSQPEMLRVARSQLNDLRDIRTEIAADVLPIDETDTPVIAFSVGDHITVPDYDGTPTEERVRSIGGNLDENGRLSWSVELKDWLLDERERNEQSQKKMINGTLRGLSKVATPVGGIGKKQVPVDRSGGGGS